MACWPWWRGSSCRWRASFATRRPGAVPSSHAPDNRRREHAAEVARAEVAAPALAVTRQFFAVHDFVRDDAGRPRIARIDSETQPGAFHVYFSILNQDYFYVVVVRADERGAPALAGGYWQPRTRVYLGVYCPDLVPAEITRRLGVPPTDRK